ncbi:MAG TPA: hypothetical protein VGE59_01030 [Patescibacteria group bacterium]
MQRNVGKNLITATLIAVGVAIAIPLYMSWWKGPEAITVAYSELLTHPSKYEGKLVAVEGWFIPVRTVTEIRPVTCLVGHTGFAPIFGVRNEPQQVTTYVFAPNPDPTQFGPTRFISLDGWRCMRSTTAGGSRVWGLVGIDAAGGCYLH